MRRARRPTSRPPRKKEGLARPRRSPALGPRSKNPVPDPRQRTGAPRLVRGGGKSSAREDRSSEDEESTKRRRRGLARARELEHRAMRDPLEREKLEARAPSYRKSPRDDLRAEPVRGPSSVVKRRARDRREVPRTSLVRIVTGACRRSPRYSRAGSALHGVARPSAR